MTRIVGIFAMMAVFIIPITVYVLGEEGVLPYRINGDENHMIYVDNVPVRVELAATPDARRQGLSGRESLAPNTGLLFLFDEPSRPGIWMKDMLFPIDIFWLDAEGTIVDIKEDARPESYPTVFRPMQDSLYILELAAGFAEIHNIEVGDKVRLDKVTEK